MKSGNCEKCGGSDIWMRYHRGRWADGCSYGSYTKTDDEHLHYGCRTCGWDWTGPVLSAERKVPV